MKSPKQTGRYLAALVMATLMAACGSDLPDPDATLASETTDYPGVVKVVAQDGSLCTGSVIGRRAVLTAAHCIETEGAYRVTVASTMFSTETRRILGSPEVDSSTDIGILIFDTDIATDDQIISLGNAVSNGETLRLVGYGCTDIDTRAGAGTKRAGVNIVSDINEHIEFVTPRISRAARSLYGADNRTGSCFGDSGGPALETNSEGKLVQVGVAHTLALGESEAISKYTDLTRSDNRTFLSQINQELELGILGL